MWITFDVGKVMLETLILNLGIYLHLNYFLFIDILGSLHLNLFSPYDPFRQMT